MSTRKLIALALACGLAILVAGGVMLVWLAGNEEQLTLDEPLAVGESADVGGRRVTVLATEQVNDWFVVEVEIAPGGEAGGDAADGWALLAGGDLRAPVPAPVGTVACAGTEIVAPAVRCVLAFEAADGSKTLSYAYGDDQHRWRL